MLSGAFPSFLTTACAEIVPPAIAVVLWSTSSREGTRIASVDITTSTVLSSGVVSGSFPFAITWTVMVWMLPAGTDKGMVRYRLTCCSWFSSNEAPSGTGSVVLEPSKATHHDQSAGRSTIMSLAFAAPFPWLVMVH